MSDKVKLKKVTADNWARCRPGRPGGEPARRQRREARRRRLPDVRRAENEGQGAGSLDLSLHDRSEAPRQWLWSRGAEQASGGDSSDPGGERDIDPLHARKSGSKAVLHQLGLSGGGWDRDGEVIAVLKL
jgi:hypothetical protein